MEWVICQKLIMKPATKRFKTTLKKLIQVHYKIFTMMATMEAFLKYSTNLFIIDKLFESWL